MKMINKSYTAFLSRLNRKGENQEMKTLINEICDNGDETKEGLTFQATIRDVARNC